MKRVFVIIFAMMVLSPAQLAAIEAAEEMPGLSEMHPREMASDTDGDGKRDRWEYFDAQGILTRIEADTNMDGKIDEAVFVTQGKIMRVEKDSDFDGQVDQWIKY